MKLNAICMVKNEGDVIAETLLNAIAFCHRIYVFDNGSTDGTWETILELAQQHEQIEIAAHSDEVFKNQLRNRVYNMFHHKYTDDDWWYILDADEMLTEDPKPLLSEADRKGYDMLRVWQAQFYFTDKDMAGYEQEDKSLPVTERRRHYRINWREPRFFKNKQNQQWSENISGRLPPFCKRFYYKAPICRHYAQRTPEQIKARNQIRINNPFSFFHLKNGKADNWLKQADDMFVYNNDGKFQFPVADRVKYFASEFRYWCQWRVKNVVNLVHKALSFATPQPR
ncbi:glycosyltransferase family 2 protein [Planctobacterium marinum]|uniref:Glycosyltransferase family 2 protein n=1 Tax=Planctobacterium marinum TaxID=1631968 RepID=A0AA48HRG3_9ALTE|nr:hypothetical protein MACH26_37780 [Planctobacterium marinum]